MADRTLSSSDRGTLKSRRSPGTSDGHMYFLECECPGTYVVYNSQKQWLLSPPERARRLLRAMDSPERSDAIVILNVPFRQEETSLITPTLSILLLKEFVGADR